MKQKLHQADLRIVGMDTAYWFLKSSTTKLILILQSFFEDLLIIYE